MLENIVKRILSSSVYDVAVESPLERMNRLSTRIGRDIVLKREDEQEVFSFKIRGAYNKMSRLSEEERERGVVASSAGNHAQGVALAAQRLGIKATIVMPITTPPIKVDAVKARKAKVVQHGDGYDDAYAKAAELMEKKGMTFIHPFDDNDVIAGQGTVGMEIMRQCTQNPEAIFVPVGGGGLIAGVAAYVKYLNPKVKVIGVEPDDAPTLHAAKEKGRRVKLPQVGIFADGVAVRQIGKHTFKIAKDYVDEVILVNSDEICAAIKDIFEDTRTVTEPAGALAVAGAKRYAARGNKITGKLVAISSGANMNFDRLRYVAERAELGEQREALLAVTIAEKPGSFLEFC
ncbi:MAG: threonine ammonia-lyase, biosynthetic, partial [Gammaproteobacteria bacterium]